MRHFLSKVWGNSDYGPDFAVISMSDDDVHHLAKMRLALRDLEDLRAIDVRAAFTMCDFYDQDQMEDVLGEDAWESILEEEIVSLDALPEALGTKEAHRVEGIRLVLDSSGVYWSGYMGESYNKVETSMLTWEDLGLPKTLSEKDGPADYWGEDPKYPVQDWVYEVRNGDTRQGYWDWVKTQIEMHEEVPE